MWALVFYKTASGKSPVSEYIKALDVVEFNKVTHDLELLREFGLDLKAPNVRSLRGAKLWELRTTGSKQHRIIYFAYTGKQMVLLHAFLKKDQRTPAAEIKTAEKRLKDFVGRLR